MVGRAMPMVRHRELTANAHPSRKRGRPRRKTHDDEASASGLRA
jgi:hypothetical protein